MASSDEKEKLPPEFAQIESEAISLLGASNDGVKAGTHDLPPSEKTGLATDFLNETKMLVDMLAGTIKLFYPSTANVLTEQTRAELANVWAPVAEECNFTMGSFMAKHGKKIAAGYTTAMLIPPMIDAIKADRNAAKLLEQQAEAAARPADPQPPRPASDPYSSAFPEPAAP